MDSNVTSNREALKNELNGRMIFDDSTVLTRLGVHQLSPEFVSACVGALEADGAVTEARNTLTSLVDSASKISVNDLEAKQEYKEEDSKVVKVKSRKRERAMYGPMVRHTFDHILRSSLIDMKNSRQFCSGRSRTFHGQRSRKNRFDDGATTILKQCSRRATAGRSPRSAPTSYSGIMSHNALKPRRFGISKALMQNLKRLSTRVHTVVSTLSALDQS